LGFQRFFFKLVTNKRFEAGVMIIILLNMVAMALEYDKMPETLEDALDCVNLMFVSVFTLECFMKLLALRWYYFKEPWNVFDFIIVVVSVISKTTHHSAKNNNALIGYNLLSG